MRDVRRAVQPGGGHAGSVWSSGSLPVVSLLDQGGNVCVYDNRTVITVALYRQPQFLQPTSNPLCPNADPAIDMFCPAPVYISLNATLSGALRLPIVLGVVRFPNLSIDKVGAAFQLSASASLSPLGPAPLDPNATFFAVSSGFDILEPIVDPIIYGEPMP